MAGLSPPQDSSFPDAEISEERMSDHLGLGKKAMV
jgi:hypothetical protein